MGLLQNGYRHNLTVKIVGATNLDGWNPQVGVYNGHRSAASRNITAGEGIADDLLAVPSGQRHPSAWIMPCKAGGLSSRNEARGVATATLTLAAGRNIAATSDGAASASATLQLVVSLTGIAAGAATVTGNVQAALGMAGTSSAGASAGATIGALAWATGSTAGSCTVTLVSYAVGRLYGSITPYTELSPESLSGAVWNALAAQYAEDSTMGKLLNMAGTGGVDYDTLAAAILAAAQVTPIHSDVRKEVGTTLKGDGTPSDKFRSTLVP